MYDSSVRVPPPELDRIAALIQNRMLVPYVNSCNRPAVNFNGLYSHKSCFLMMAGVTRNIEGVTRLAREDMYMLQPATSAARSAFEAAIRVLWILHPPDTEHRERRWLRFIHSIEHEYYRRLIKRYEDGGVDTSGIKREQQQLRSRINRIAAELQVSKLKSMPNRYDILNGIDEDHKYILYDLMSQFAHTEAFSLIHRHGSFEPDALIFEGPEIGQWAFTLLGCWWCLWKAGNRFLKVSGIAPFITAQDAEQIRSSIYELAVN